MNKIFSLGMGIIVASQVGSAPAFAAVADLQKAADTAQAAAHASADKAYTLSGTTYDNNSATSETSASAPGSVSASKHLETLSQKPAPGQNKVRVPQLASKPRKSVGEGAGAGFVAGFMGGFLVCMAPAMIIGQIPIVNLVNIVVAPVSAVIGVVVGLFTGAFGAMAGAVAGGVIGG